MFTVIKDIKMNNDIAVKMGSSPLTEFAYLFCCFRNLLQDLTVIIINNCTMIARSQPDPFPVSIHMATLISVGLFRLNATGCGSAK